MPKKTKKEKIIAEYRRKLESASILKNNPNHLSTTIRVPPPDTAHPYHLTSVNKSVNISYGHKADFPDDFPAIRQDMVKTLIFAAMAVIIELLLYVRIGK